MRATFNFTWRDCTSFTNTPRTIRPATCNARRLNLRNLFLPWIHWFCLSYLTGRVLRLKLIRLNSHHDRFCTSRCEAKFVVFNKNSKITSCNHITFYLREPCTPMKIADAGSSNPSFYRPLLNGDKSNQRKRTFSVRKITFWDLKEHLGNIFFNSGVIAIGVFSVFVQPIVFSLLMQIFWK